jgi:dihydrofolate reductase
MGRIVVSALTTLDGVQHDPTSWINEPFDASFIASAIEALDRADAMLMGRGTYEYFAPMWPNVPGPHADRVNAIKKYVVLPTLTEVGWNNCELLGSDPVATSAWVRSRAERDILIYGYGRLAGLLLRAGLVDQIDFTVFPLVHGSGQPLLQEGALNRVTLDSVTQHPSGAVKLSYSIAGPSAA